MLRVSGGQWNTQKVLKQLQTTGNTSNLVGESITGQSSSALGVVIESVKKFLIGSKEVSEFIVNEDTISGTFTIGETLRYDDTDDFFIKATITGILHRNKNYYK